MSRTYEKHGLSRTRLYNIWIEMRQRCNTPTRARYEDYGGRGIRVCKAWDCSFIAFRDWSINTGYTNALTLDRRNNNRGYCPSNCRWATRSQQQHNTRKRRGKSEYRGVHRSHSRWRASVTKNGKRHYVNGYFKIERDAAVGRDLLAIQLLGKDANLNFPRLARVA